QSWKQTVSASKWIWMTPLPFGIIIAVMSIDNVIRQFLTLASEYWKVIELPIASYGLIGSGMALLGLFVPRISRILAEKNTPVKNFILTVVLVFLGLYGLSMAIPRLGILPAIMIYVGMGMTNFFVSRYMNEAAPSEQRATVLSFRGLTTNLAYGMVSIFYSLLIASIKRDEPVTDYVNADAMQTSVFVESLRWFPGYFLITVALVFLVYRVRFGFGRKS
ncbi:MAG: MFS transporter, partial [Verrucomicrobiota bacterium]